MGVNMWFVLSPHMVFNEFKPLGNEKPTLNGVGFLTSVKIPYSENSLTFLIVLGLQPRIF